MIEYLDTLVFICMIILLGNLLATIIVRKKELLSKIMYMFHSVGIIIISNSAIWKARIYLDYNNLSGNGLSFYLNVINVIVCLVTVFILLKYTTTDDIKVEI